MYPCTWQLQGMNVSNLSKCGEVFLAFWLCSTKLNKRKKNRAQSDSSQEEYFKTNYNNKRLTTAGGEREEKKA